MQQSDALYLFNEGRNFQAYRLLGAEAGANGTMFRVWAPNAAQVLVLGDFNAWQGAAHAMHAISGAGIWELEVPEAVPGSLYRFAITNRETGVVHIKSDPYARGFEKRPGSAAYVVEPSRHVWSDDEWLNLRNESSNKAMPLLIYEVHLGSWKKEHGQFMNYRKLAVELAFKSIVCNPKKLSMGENNKLRGMRVALVDSNLVRQVLLFTLKIRTSFWVVNKDWIVFWCIWYCNGCFAFGEYR